MLALVAEKTGYPADMLDLDLDLEADLGIDTVKQAELFASDPGGYGIARDDKLKLRDFPTLATSSPSCATATRPPRGRACRAAAPAQPVARRSRWRVAPAPVAPAAVTRCGARCWRWWPRRPATRPTCWISTWIWRPIWGSTRSSRPSCSPPIREAYGIARDDELKLRDFPTLATSSGSSATATGPATALPTRGAAAAAAGGDAAPAPVACRAGAGGAGG